MKVEMLEEVLNVVNDVKFGFSVFIFMKLIGCMFLFVNEMDVGFVCINVEFVGVEL